MIPYLDIEQYSPEWWAIRRGVPTASQFARIITPAKRELAAAHVKYINQLIGDLYDTQYGTAERYQNADMREGNRREPESRYWYAMNQDEGLDVSLIGFCTTDDGRFGCSPDALVGDCGLLQAKNPSPEVHAGYLLKGGLPIDYAPQCYGELYVTGRQWLDFVSYCPGFPSQLVVRIFPKGPFWDALVPILEEFYLSFTSALEAISGKRLAAGRPAREILTA